MKTYLFTCEDVSAKFDLAESAFAQSFTKHVVPNGVALLLGVFVLLG